MSFTTGQLIFAAVFLVIFIVLLVRTYRSDKLYIKKYYRGSWKILLTILLAFVALWFLVKWMS